VAVGGVLGVVGVWVRVGPGRGRGARGGVDNQWAVGHVGVGAVGTGGVRLLLQQGNVEGWDEVRRVVAEVGFDGGFEAR